MLAEEEKEREKKLKKFSACQAASTISISKLLSLFRKSRSRRGVLYDAIFNGEIGFLHWEWGGKQNSLTPYVFIKIHFHIPDYSWLYVIISNLTFVRSFFYETPANRSQRGCEQKHKGIECLDKKLACSMNFGLLAHILAFTTFVV